MTFRPDLVLVCGLMAVAVAPASAQGPYRQDVVVTAAAEPVEFGTVTKTLTVITRDQIARLPVANVADVLRLVASVDVRARGERGVQTDFAVRGANFGQMLVLVDGVRLNDAQTGHHNGDIPVPLDAVERIEVLHGPGSSLFGADAFGGTINVITRRDTTESSAGVEVGSFGLVAGRGRTGFTRGGLQQTVAAQVERSSGFMFERGFATASVSSQLRLGNRSNVSVSYLWKDFGANGFYGNAPSHEWTNQALLSADRTYAAGPSWQVNAGASYRTHGDRFLFDVRRPGVAENQHRTHAVLGSVRAGRTLNNRASLTTAIEFGHDWVRSSNLGDHATTRVSAGGEWRFAVRPDTQLDASVRVERYNEFGTAWSPSIGIGWWPAPSIRLRSSAGRAFRVPTFTERYYSDPANWARPEVGPESAWAVEAGTDVFVTGGWALAATLFGRADHDVIDWLRATTAERWRTYNIRDVDTVGVEMSARKQFVNGSFLQIGYTGLDVRADAVTQLSKYVLDFAPHSFVAAASVGGPGGIQVAPRLEYRHRTRSTGTSDYALLDVRVSRRVGMWEARLEGTNLANVAYQEVTGVAMPGRALSASLVVRP